VLATDLPLMAHLMRRAGFGATRDQLEELAASDYGAIVDDLLHPERFPEVPQDVFDRYYPTPMGGIPSDYWVFLMINSDGPLREKMALFWHQVFPTGWDKVGHPLSSRGQIEMFRKHALSDFKTILIELSKDPAMIMWLDNNENLKEEPNENYGRELLELFSMGVGNYTEEDVKGATRAFTGWTFLTPFVDRKRDGYPTRFVFGEGGHDHSQKGFLGEKGDFNGEDIVEIIARQPATARFISRRLYDFFVADEPAVASWNETPPQDPEAIDTLAAAYFASGGNIRSMLEVLFNSEFFKRARFKVVKSPIELVVGLTRLLGTQRFPDRNFGTLTSAANSMGQQLLQPLTVEGWRTGQEWIDGGTLNDRVNFAAEQVGDPNSPGVREIVNRFASLERSLPPGEFVEACLDLMGVDPDDDTREGLLRHAGAHGELRFGTEAERRESEFRVLRMLQLIVSVREFQFA